MNKTNFLSIFFTLLISACVSDPNYRHAVELSGKTDVPLGIRADAGVILAKKLLDKGCPQIGSIKVRMIEKSSNFAYEYKNRVTVITNGFAIEMWNIYACGNRSYSKVTYKPKAIGGITIESTENTIPWWIWLDT